MSPAPHFSQRSSIRLIHFSDIHLPPPHARWALGDWFSKRATGWFNLRCLGRGRRFALADRAVTALATDLQQRQPDHVVFSGDATSLGFEEEMAHAAELLRVGKPSTPAGLAVPGNHDYYTRAGAASGLFERYFAGWQNGERVDGAAYPFAQRVGPVWLIGVNSCTGNRWFWDAAGSVGSEQLGRLSKLFQRLDSAPRILVTHYPVCLAGGEPERRYHALRDVSDVVRVAVEGNVCLWLHGHQHRAYCVASPQIAPFPILCVGTATQQGRWSYGEYTIRGRELHVLRRVYMPGEDRFQDRDAFDLQLPG